MAQQRLFTEEHRDDLPLVNLLRDDVRRWREAGYRGATTVTKELLRHWAREDRYRRLFFCQREAVETIIYLAEIRIPGKSSSTGFHKFALADADLTRLLRGERPSFDIAAKDFFPTGCRSWCSTTKGTGGTPPARGNPAPATNGGKTQRVLRYRSRHLLFPQVYRFVNEYVEPFGSAGIMSR